MSLVTNADYPYQTLNSSFKDKGELIEIYPNTPAKDQGQIGLCYGFAAASLLEHYRCRELRLSCTDSKDMISVLDVTSYEQGSEKGLKEGGMPLFILGHISNSEKKIAKEECAPYSSLLRQVEYQGKSYKNEFIGWQFLTEGWRKLHYERALSKNSNECTKCMAQNIKCQLSNLKTPMEQIELALKDAEEVEKFLYKTIIPRRCLDDSQTLEIPDFEVKSFPTFKDSLESTPLKKKITELLESHTPIQINICVEKNISNKCSAAHSIDLFGIKNVCSEISKDCKKLVKVKNSYGKDWQTMNNDGWVDLDTLIESAKDFSEGNNIIWLEKPKK
jgi:hypothetical protein